MIALRQEPFDPWKEIEAYQDKAFGRKGTFGATASFVGTMRDFNEGDRVCRMSLEHYPGMTEKHLEQIVAEARRRWDRSCPGRRPRGKAPRRISPPGPSA